MMVDPAQVLKGIEEDPSLLAELAALGGGGDEDAELQGREGEGGREGREGRHWRLAKESRMRRKRRMVESFYEFTHCFPPPTT